LCRCPATGAVIQFFQKCKWSRNEQNHVWEGGDDSYTVRSHQTHRETDKQSYVRSTEGCRPSSNFSKNVSPHGSSERTERKTKTNNLRATPRTYVPTYPPPYVRTYHHFRFYIYDLHYMLYRFTPTLYAFSQLLWHVCADFAQHIAIDSSTTVCNSLPKMTKISDYNRIRHPWRPLRSIVSTLSSNVNAIFSLLTFNFNFNL
jgi:hypothetical protein